jgi:hypothetical protein
MLFFFVCLFVFFFFFFFFYVSQGFSFWALNTEIALLLIRFDCLFHVSQGYRLRQKVLCYL